MDQKVEVESDVTSVSPVGGKKHKYVPKGKAPSVGKAGLLISTISAVVALAIGLGLGALLEWSHIENDVVATVNGTPIKSGDFYHRLQMAAGNQVLGAMITDEMRLQFAKQENAYPSNDKIDTALVKAAATPDYQTSLTKAHETTDDVRQSIAVHLAQIGPIEKGVSVTDADAMAFYNANIDHKNLHARYYRPQTVQIRAIITSTQAAANAAYNALAAGNTFAAVAQQFSQDRSAQQGGVLPAFQKGRINSSKAPGLEQLIFSMVPNEQTPVTKIGNSYWIIQCIGTLPETTVPFAKVADECHEGAMLTKGLQVSGQQIQQAEKDFQKSSSFQFNWPGYSLSAANSPAQTAQ